MIKITLKRSVIGYEKSQCRTVKSLGLGRIGSAVVHEDTPVIQGMIRKVSHLLEVEQLVDAAVEETKE